MERLTNKAWRNLDPWECCGQDKYCQRGCHDPGGCTKGCIVPQLYARLGAYEDTGLTPQEVKSMQEEHFSGLEMAELQNVLCKFLRGRIDGDTLANIAEEIADVGIMLDQMAIEFKVEDAVAEQRAVKVRRLRSRLDYVEQEG
nr:MAG TPA: nucleoside triphosphate pyrophosphohydrolase [Bacteriophage sp.]